ncbi:hypothetical protein [Pseudoalteromonas sp. C12FD-1]|uniref:hypothetical protein n=1 Tax=Pseudoalteromonas sp. C12FD-1 TaxID=3131979 RepID=UPI00307D8B6A
MQKLTSTLIMLVCVSLISACTPPSSKRRVSSPPEFEVKSRSATGGECQCQGAEVLTIKNKGAGAGRLAATKYTRLINSDAVDKKTTTYRFEPGQERVFACSVAPISNSEPECHRQNTIEAFGNQYPKAMQDLSRDSVIQIVQGNLAGAPDTPTPMGYCVSKCKFNQQGGCDLKLEGGGDSELGIKIANLITSTGGNSSISVSKIQELTASGKNECNRTDIGFLNYVGYNYGDKCDIEATLPPSFGTTKITIGSNFMLDISKGPGVGNFTMTFPNLPGGIDVTFSDSVLQSSFGGRISQVDYRDKMYAIETGSGKCVAVEI